MEWYEIYNSNNKPSLEQITEYVNSSLWTQLCDFIEQNYNVNTKIEYSTCSMKPGWNVKYKKSNKSICTLYPNKDFFTCMLTISGKSQDKVEYILPSCCEYVQHLYKNTSIFNNGRWLMFDVTDTSILEDVLEIISIKMQY